MPKIRKNNQVDTDDSEDLVEQFEMELEEPNPLKRSLDSIEAPESPPPKRSALDEYTQEQCSALSEMYGEDDAEYVFVNYLDKDKDKLREAMEEAYLNATIDSVPMTPRDYGLVERWDEIKRELREFGDYKLDFKAIIQSGQRNQKPEEEVTTKLEKLLEDAKKDYEEADGLKKMAIENNKRDAEMKKKAKDFKWYFGFDPEYGMESCEKHGEPESDCKRCQHMLYKSIAECMVQLTEEEEEKERPLHRNDVRRWLEEHKKDGLWRYEVPGYILQDFIERDYGVFVCPLDEINKKNHKPGHYYIVDSEEQHSYGIPFIYTPKDEHQEIDLTDFFSDYGKSSYNKKTDTWTVPNRRWLTIGNDLLIVD